MKYEGRLLNLGTVDKCNRKFSEDCLIVFSDKVPVVFNFQKGPESVLGFAEISRDVQGLKCKATIHHKSFDDKYHYVGGYYDKVVCHPENGITVIDSCRLVGMSITLFPADESLKIVKCEDD